MIRIIIENILLFLLPVAVYAGYMLLTRRRASPGEVFNDAPLVWLFVAGASMVIVSLVYFASTTISGSPDQKYTPPHMKDGRIQPGELK
jgi:hypothetical protein